mmetsp:Transcript_43257/g.122520  ORF Transcript_43257/g.122520 Transcript_43257/m.122520 type:complete len:99 (-) Transcript_43257:1463-1759(-)
MIGKFEKLKSLEAQRAKMDEQHTKLVYGLDETDKIVAVKAILPKQAYQQPLAFLNLQQQNEANNNFAAFQQLLRNHCDQNLPRSAQNANTSSSVGNDP